MYVKFKSHISYLISNLFGSEFGKIEIKKKKAYFLEMLKKGEKKMGEGQDRRRVGLGCRSPFGKGKKLIWVVLSLIIKATHMVILDHFLISNSYFFSSSFFFPNTNFKF